jgi:hypothetical protein
MLESVSYDDGDGNRAHLAPWPSAPNIHSTSDECTKNKTVWSAYQEKVRRFIPRIAYKSFEYDSDSDSNSEGDHSLSTEADDEDSVVASGSIDEEASNGRRKEAKEARPEVPKSASTPSSTKIHLREPGKKKAENADDARTTYRSVRIQEDDPSQLNMPLDEDEEPRKRISKARKRASSGTDIEQHRESKRSKVEHAVELASSSALPLTTPATFPFLENLTTQALQGEAEALLQDFAVVLKSSVSDKSRVFSFYELVNEYRGILQDPTSHLAPSRIRHIQVQLRAHAMMNAMEAINVRRERFLVLLSSVHIWYWLDVVIKAKIEAIFKSGSTEATSAQHGEGWLIVLVDSIKDGLLRRLDPIELNPDNSLSLLPLRSSVIRVPNPSKRIYLERGTPQEQENLLGAIVVKAQKALMDCLQYPLESDIKDRRRAWLMGTLADVIGQEFLATQYAWNAWSSFSVKRFFGGDPQAYGNNPDLVQPFRDALKAHPICVDGSETWKAYQSFRLLLQDPSKCLEASTASSHSVIAVDSTTTSAPPSQAHWFDGLDEYLRRCIEFERGAVSTDSPLHQFLLSKPDSRLPFREKAPSRIRIRAGNTSPYNETTIRTDAGIFSAIIYRGITYNTPFSQHSDAPTLFEDFSDWERKIREFKHQHPAASATKNFFCRPNAYGGQSITGRSVETARAFWEGVKALDWPEQTQRLMNFEECYDLFRKAKFPTMGVLCCYLLTCDLHYAGICRAPTVPDVASIMRQARGGSYHVIPTLGFGEAGTHPPQKVVMDALVAIQEHLTEVFTEEERDLMGFDLICVEHILCKFKRAIAAMIL